MEGRNLGSMLARPVQLVTKLQAAVCRLAAGRSGGQFDGPRYALMVSGRLGGRVVEPHHGPQVHKYRMW